MLRTKLNPYIILEGHQIITVLDIIMINSYTLILDLF